MPVLSSLLNYYPHLQALSASSPIWAGVDTGYASNRALMFQQLPTAGLPFQFADAGRSSRRSPATSSPPASSTSSPRSAGTSAPRRTSARSRTGSATASPTFDELAALVALMHCLVVDLDTRLAAGETLPTMPPWHVQENKWRAARYGLDAIIILDAASNERLVTDDLADLLERLAPVADRLGCAAELRVGRRDPAPRARRTSASARSPPRTGGDLVAVVDSVVRELREGLERRCGSVAAGSGGRPSRGGRRAAAPGGRARRASSSETAASASTSGSLVGSGRVRLRVTRDERPQPDLDPDPRRRPALRVDVGDHPPGQRADLLGDPVPVLEVVLVGLLAAVRPRHPRRRVDRAGVHAAAEPVVPRPHRRAELGGEHPGVGRGRAGRRCRCRARPAACAVLRADPPQRRRSAARPSPRTSSRRSAGRPRAACRSRWRSWRAACCRRCRPSSAARSRPAPRRGSARRTPAGRPSGAVRPRPAARNASSQPSTSTHHRHAAPLEAAQRLHHLRRGRVVGRRVDRQEHRVRALAGGHPQRHARSPTPYVAGLVRRGRHHAALGRVAAAADHHRQARRARGGAAPRPRR